LVTLTIEERVKEIIATELRLSAEAEDEVAVALDDKLADDLFCNSFDKIELILAFEEAFHIHIPDKDAERIRTVQGAIHCISRLAANRTQLASSKLDNCAIPARSRII